MKKCPKCGQPIESFQRICIDCASDHLSEWMSLQEQANKDIAAALLRIEERLEALERSHIHLMEFTGLIDNSPPTAEEEEWARKLIAEGRHLQPGHPLKRT